jgi:hypothetical protein
VGAAAIAGRFVFAAKEPAPVHPATSVLETVPTPVVTEIQD